MKKLILILVGVALTVGILATAGFVYAQTQDPPESPDDADMPFGPGFMKGRRGRGRGGFGGPGFGGDGALQEYMLPAMARAFGLTDEQISALQDVRETMQEARADLTAEEMKEKMSAAFNEAIEAALADGAITQEEADQLRDRMENFGEGGFPGHGRRGGPDGFSGERKGLLKEYMQPALADALGLSVEELEALHEDGGFNLKDYAEEQGWSDEELQELMSDVFANAVNAALEDGAITQEQADWMLERMGDSGPRMPFGPGGRGGCWGDQ